MATWLDHDGSSDTGDVGKAGSLRLSTSAARARER